VTLQRKLALFLVAAAVAPLVGVAFAVLRGAQDELARRAAAEHSARARAGAVAIAAELAEVDGALAALCETWRPDRLAEAELRGMLVVLSRQVPAADASAVVDAAGSARAALAGDPRDVTDRFVEAVRTSSGIPEGRLVLRAYDDAEGWRLAAVRAVPARAGPPWLVAVRLAGDHARRRLDAAVPEGGAAWLLDGARVLAASTGAGPIPPEQRAELSGRLDPARPSVVQGRQVLAAWAPLDDGTGLGVLVAVPAQTAYAPIAAMRRGVLLASLAVLAAVLGASFLIGRATVAGIARIESAARALGGGELAVRLPVRGTDEVAQVSRTFNAMAAELQRAREKLERWNEELRREVDARTAELKVAQAQLLESQKLAALGQLGAGVAHEINNPLTTILGFAQLLAEQAPQGSPDREVLESIEAQARRCRDITWNLLRFSEQRAEPDFVALDASEVARDAIALARTQMEKAGVPIDAELAEPGPRVRGDAGHLAQVILHLLSNARTACVGRPEARVRVSVGREGDEVRIAVRDGGKGIAAEHLPRIFEPFFTTKDLWSNVGLGLSVSYRIVSEHGGRLRVESTPGEGSTFTVCLPALPADGAAK
jgi:signal transduction histidine kinase